MGMTPKTLAKTLVHEVNHVLNRSEEHYRGDKNVFIEDYRAHYVEGLFDGKRMDKRTCLGIKNRVIRNYGLDVKPDDIPDKPNGIIFPKLNNVA